MDEHGIRLHWEGCSLLNLGVGNTGTKEAGSRALHRSSALDRLFSMGATQSMAGRAAPDAACITAIARQKHF